jgi:GAF domain-containing protein
MYDPLVVDTFIAVFSEIAPLAIQAGQQARSFMPSLDGRSGSDPLQQIRTNAEQTTLLEECALALKHATSRREATDIAAQFLGMLTPAGVCAFFEYSPDDDLLTCRHAAGDTSIDLKGVVIRNGERTTGWAVAHDTVMANSPATLDLPELATLFRPALKTAIVAPVKRDGKVLGALSAYSKGGEHFSDDHQYAVERIASAFSAAIHNLSGAGAAVPVRAEANR